MFEGRVAFAHPSRAVFHSFRIFDWVIGAVLIWVQSRDLDPFCTAGDVGDDQLKRPVFGVRRGNEECNQQTDHIFLSTENATVLSFQLPLVAIVVRLHKRIVDNVEINSEESFKRFLIELRQINSFLFKRGQFYKFSEELLNAIQVAWLKEVQMLSRGFQDFGDSLIIEQEMNPDHALGE